MTERRDDIDFALNPQLKYPRESTTMMGVTVLKGGPEPCVGCGEESDECLTGKFENNKECLDGKPSIWLPVGKKPSDLWIGESNSFNDVFIMLYEYFKEHESYSFEYMGYDYNDELITKYGGMKILRISKWLSYFGLLGIERQNVTKGETVKLLNKITPTGEGWRVFETGRQLRFEWTHLTKPDVIGVGKPYPSWAETEKWLENSYGIYKVPKYKQLKWHSEFVREYYSCLHLNREEMRKAMVLWLQNHVATIKRRGKPFMKQPVSLENDGSGFKQASLFDVRG